MTNTNNLSIPLVVQSQAQKEVTINEAFYILEALQNRGVIDKDLAAPPSTPLAGDCYIVASAPTGLWAGKTKNIAYYNNGWKFIEPKEGLIIWVNDEDKVYIYNGAAWVAYGESFSNLSLLGVNATADSGNKFAVASDAILLNHNGSDFKTKLNKNAAANTASFLLQNNFSGRAEFGLIGDDDFCLKTSADGSSWNNSFKASKTDGCIDFLNGIKFAAGTKFSNYEEGTFTPTFLGSTTAGTPTYAVQTGIYTRIGRIINFNVRLQISALGGMAGGLRIGGLPFTCGALACPAVIGEQINLAASIYDMYAFVQPSTTQVYLYKAASTGTAAFSSSADITATTRIWVGGTYYI